MKRVLIALGMAGSLLVGTHAFAQVDFGASYGISLGSDLMNGAMMSSAYAPASRSRRQPSGPVMGAAAEEAMRARRGHASSTRSPTGPARVETRYTADPAVTARVQRQFVDFVRERSGAAGGDAMARAFASQDLLQSWARQARPDGMRLGDVADAMAEYWVTNWLIAHGRLDAPPATVVGVRDQVRGVLARAPAFARLSQAQRQEMAEALIYNTLLQGEVAGDAMKRGDTALVARAGDAAVARFRNEAGVDLRRVELTGRGFRPVG